MKPIIIEMKDMSESVEVYESRPNPFFIYFIYLILILFIVAMVWMYFSRIDLVVKSKGVFRNSEHPVEISSSAAGKIIESKVKEGQYVEQGEVLVTIEAESLELAMDTQKEALQNTRQRLEILRAYDRYLKGKEDALDSYKENPYYPEFLGKKQLLALGQDVSEKEKETQKKQVEAELLNIQELERQYEEQIAKLKTTQEGIKNRTNPFSAADSYYQSIISSYLSGYELTTLQYDTKVEQQGALIKEAEKQIGERERRTGELEQQRITIEQNLQLLQSKAQILQIPSAETESSVLQEAEENLEQEIQKEEPAEETEGGAGREENLQQVSAKNGGEEGGQESVEQAEEIEEEGLAEEGSHEVTDSKEKDSGQQTLPKHSENIETQEKVEQEGEGSETHNSTEEIKLKESLTQIEREKEENKKAIETLRSQITEYQKTIEQLKKEKENSLSNLELQQITSLEQQIDTISRTLQSTKTNESSLRAQLEILQEAGEGKTEQINLLTEQQSVADQLLSCETKEKEYENALKQYDLENGQAKIVAAHSGYLSLTQDWKEGSYITQGATIGQILPEEGKGYYAELYVENADVAKLKEGQKVTFEIEAYPSKEYGTISGTIESISKDSKVDSAVGSAYYLAKVTCDETLLMNQDGQSGEIMNGMVCQAKVIVGEKNVLQLLLQKLDFME